MYNLNKLKDRRFLITVSAAAAALIFAGFFLLYGNPLKQSAPKGECDTSVEEKIVQGNSMSGIVEAGQTVRAVVGYYKCNDPVRNDLVLYSYSGDPNPLIKIVRGIPGDRFGFRKSGINWNILLNGEVLKNAQSQPYLIGDRSYKLLSLYEHDFKGVIPKNAYLILGNLPDGTLDSTRFGLIGKSDLYGKAELK